MLDIRWVREHVDEVRESLRRRGADFDLNYFLGLDRQRRAKIAEVDEMRARQNEFAEGIARAPAGARAEKIAESRALKEELGHAEFALKALEEEFDDLMRKIPNMLLPDVPVGKDERDNVVLREVGDKPRFDFAPRDYMDIAMRSGLIDTARAAKVSGSRFGYVKGDLARLEFALVQFAFERLAEKGFIPIVPPVMIKEDMMQKLGYVDTEKDKAERYFLPNDKMYFVGTAEQSVVPMHADEIFAEKDLPRRYVAFSSCFRREAGSYGKDTHGILRVHQFDKVEMVSFTKPEDSKKEHEFLLAAEEELMAALRIPYRAVALCAGDLARPSAATYDIEAWLPGQNNGKGEYRETHSCSNTTNFQARRLNIRYRRADDKVAFVHILNGTACAIGRMQIAILENYQRADGSAAVPEALRQYAGGVQEIHNQK